MANPKEFLAELETAHRQQGRRRAKSISRQRQFFEQGTQGGFWGAKTDRLTEDWHPGNLSPNAIHRMDGALLRQRARDLVENNPLAKSGVEAYIANVIECGILPKPRLSEGERLAQVMAWNRWGGEYGDNEADSTGQQHIYELMTLWLTEILVGGGCLVNYVVLPRAESRTRFLPLTLELIPEERFADDKDDYVLFHNRRKGNNRIVRGVEIDSRGRPVNFWVRPDHPNEPAGILDPISISAADAHYSFFRRRVGQYRGYTLLSAAIMWLWKLGYYTDNELMASAIRSCFAAVIQMNKDDWPDYDGIADGNQSLTDLNGNVLERLQPGIVARMTAPGTIQTVGPNVPTNEASAWLMFIERCISIAINLSYEEVARDFSQGNFSSTRASANSDRKRFRPMQKFVVNHFCQPTWRRFAQWASWRGIDGFPTLDAFLADLHNWINVKWRTPGWVSVNPWDDVRAAAMEIEHGMGTREDYIASKGGDWEDKFDQLEDEENGGRQRDLTFIRSVDAAIESTIDPNEPSTTDSAQQEAS